MIIDTESLCTTEEIGEIAGVSPGTIRAWIRRGKIRPLVTISGRVALWEKSQVREIKELAENAVYGRPRKCSTA